jgi:hypothetical protein
MPVFGDVGAWHKHRYTCRIDRIGLVGFEPTTSWSRTRRSTKLSHSPLYLYKTALQKYRNFPLVHRFYPNRFCSAADVPAGETCCGDLPGVLTLLDRSRQCQALSPTFKAVLDKLAAAQSRLAAI